MNFKFSHVIIALLASVFTLNAQSICTDWNGYVNYKNVGATGYYTLLSGFEDRAAQTYHYSSQGKINQVRVYGNFQGLTGGVPLRVAIHQVDGAGRPTSVIQSVDTVWWWFNNIPGYITVSFGAGVPISSNFAVSVGIRQAFPFGNSFQVKYTGNGEGLGKDLASLAGPSTGGNWVSALTDFTKDGDFYLVPQISSFNIPSFHIPSNCIAAGANIAFTNTSQITRDSMFNRIGLAGYNGGNKYFTWNFGDGSPVSNAQNPNHSYSNPGVYNVSLTTTLDGWDGVCSETYSLQISVGLSVADSLVTAIKCNSAATGVISAKASGGALLTSIVLMAVCFSHQLLLAI